MLSSTWQKIYIEAINGLCANFNNSFGNNKEESAKRIIEQATILANIGDKNFNELNE